MLAIHTALNLFNYVISRLFLSAAPFSKLRFQTDQMKNAGYLNGTFHLFRTRLSVCCNSSVCYCCSMVHEAALPKAKQHGMRATKARREEMLKHMEGSAATKEQSKMDGAASA